MRSRPTPIADASNPPVSTKYLSTILQGPAQEVNDIYSRGVSKEMYVSRNEQPSGAPAISIGDDDEQHAV